MVHHKQLTLEQEAKAGFSSLLKQSFSVFIGLLIMLLLTGGTPSGFVVGLSFSLGVAFVAWSEKQRLTNQQTENISGGGLSRLGLSYNNLPLFRSRRRKLLSMQLNSHDQRGANLIRINLTGYNLSRADLRGANLIRINLSGYNLSRADLSGANLSGANLVDANLKGANLSGANLVDANLKGAILFLTNLTCANLIGANLGGAKLTRANLSGADLSGADLSSANLTRTHLLGTKLSGAVVEKARFGDNLGLTEEIELNLKQRGAIFKDSSGDRSEVLSRR
jgi:uncharacterized protein YjbI with pentapeptide repeats